jgi:signal transduction histidine kinase/ActR/RegA family two-component response regulator
MEVSGAGIALKPQPLSVLIIEDSEEDADLVLLELRRGGFVPKFTRVDTPHALKQALDEGEWDLVLSDFSMPRFSMPHALAMVREKGRDVPFLIVSATIGEEAAVDAMRAGAHDYILKDKLGRLVPAIKRELKEVESRRERKQLEEQLRQAQKLESLGLLAGGVAHDFNNLLTGILGNASLVLEMLSPPEPERSMLEDVVRASERAAELTRQLLAYAGKGKFVVRPVHMSEVVREIGQLVRSSIPRQVELKMDLHSDLPLVEADPSQMQQLVMNLVINAAEAMGNNTGLIEVTTSVRRSDDGIAVSLRVHDTGCGMDEPTKSHIFDPFFTTKFTGRGLGLAAVQGIVRSHNGRIEVISEPNCGSTFEILLPAMERSAEMWHEPEPAQTPVVPTGGGVVLVVDDEEIVRRTAAVTLQRYGYSVVEAENGRDAVALFEEMKGTVEVVLLDLTMPVMTGEETYRQIKEIDPTVPVIVSSGYDEVEAARRFGAEGLADFIQKPYVAHMLADKVKSAIRHQSAE